MKKKAFNKIINVSFCSVSDFLAVDAYNFFSVKGIVYDPPTNATNVGKSLHEVFEIFRMITILKLIIKADC